MREYVNPGSEALEMARDLNEALGRTYHLLRPAYDLALGHHSVRMLQSIWIDGPLSVGESAALLSIAQNSASELAARLVAKGLIEKRRSPEDDRRVELCLTKAGRRAVENHTGLDLKKLAACLAALGTRESRELATALGALQEVAARCFSR